MLGQTVIPQRCVRVILESLAIGYYRGYFRSSFVLASTSGCRTNCGYHTLSSKLIERGFFNNLILVLLLCSTIVGMG